VPEVGSIGITGSVLANIRLVFHLDKRVAQAGCQQTAVKHTDLVVLFENVGNGAVGVLQQHRDGLYNTVLDGVVFQFEDDMRHTIKLHHRVLIGVCGVRDLDISLVHIGRVQRTVVHLDGGIHIAHEMTARYGVTLFLGEIFHRCDSLLLEICTNHIV